MYYISSLLSFNMESLELTGLGYLPYLVDDHVKRHGRLDMDLIPRPP